MLPLFLFIIGIVLGIGGTNFYDKHGTESDNFQLMENVSRSFFVSEMDDFYNNFFDDEFFRHHKLPFKQIEKMKTEMSKLLKESQNAFPSDIIFDDWYKSRFGGKVGDIEQSEDKDFIYFKVHLPGIDKENVKVEVREGTINISGKSERVEKKEGNEIIAKSFSRETFERRFPIPPNANGNKFDFKFDDDYLLIHFLKMSRSVGGP